jgi:hypothetical protein
MRGVLREMRCHLLRGINEGNYLRMVFWVDGWYKENVLFFFGETYFNILAGARERARTSEVEVDNKVRVGPFGGMRAAELG